jgi:cytoskeleton protein RodZ
MKNLGEYLRAERLARGISLEQISANTKVSMSMLQAIEEGDIGQLPAMVFTKGFLRAYAEQIGLDPEAVIVEYQDLTEEVDARQTTIEMFQQRLRPEPTKKRLLALLLTLPLLAGLTLALWRFNYVWQESPLATTGEPVELSQVSPGNDSVSGLHQSQSAMEPREDVEVGQESQVGSAIDSNSDRHQAQSALQSQQALDLTSAGIGPRLAESEFDTQTPPHPPADEKVTSTHASGVYPEYEDPQQVEPQPHASAPYTLKAEATETTWLSISIDEMKGREYLLKPGEQVTWEATKGFKLRIGNAAGIQLSLNDEPIKPLGRSGRVVRLELPDPSLVNISNSPTAAE